MDAIEEDVSKSFTDMNTSDSSSWKKAATVLHAVKISKGFKTLRDMMPAGESLIDSGRLNVKSPLGEGAFAFVNLAVLDGARSVAVKTLKPELLENQTDVELFIEETSLMRKLQHPFIVELVGMGGTSRDPYASASDAGYMDLFIVQEFCAGGSLRDLVFKQMVDPMKPLYSQRDALRWCIQICKSLEYLHSAKPIIIHRDLKLDNVLLTSKNVGEADAKLGDFGLAKLVSGSKEGKKMQQEAAMLSSQPSWSPLQRRRSSKLDVTLERLDTVLSQKERASALSIVSATTDYTGVAGSFSYMAPEVLLCGTSGVKYDEKCDIFSFANIMYNLFYRVIPSVLIMANGGEPEDLAMLAHRVANGYRPTLTQTSVPKEVNFLINACWSGVSTLRPSAREVRRALERIDESGVCSGGKGHQAGGEGKAPGGCACSLM